MPRFRASLFGKGRTEIAAFGSADAEASLEKEIREIAGPSQFEIRSIRRTDARPRIVETFEIAYALRLTVFVESADAKSARHEAFMAGRRALAGSRFHHIEWRKAELKGEG